MKQKSSIIERLKIAWYALTLKNYIYVGIKEEPALFDNDGNYVGIVNGSIKSYSYIDDTIKYKVNKEKYCKDNDISNVIFYGRIEKDKIFYILSHADANILTYKQVNLMKYGGSQSKLFDYLACGKPIICNRIR